MTIGERVADFLRQHRGHPLCDDCIARTLGLARRQEAFAATSALKATREFVRDQDECSKCGKTKTTTRAVG
jgi:ribosomal protein L37AE/L43A